MLLTFVSSLKVFILIAWSLCIRALVAKLATTPILGLAWWLPEFSGRGGTLGAFACMLLNPVRGLAILTVFSMFWLPLWLAPIFSAFGALDRVYYSGICPIFVDTECGCFRAYRRMVSPDARPPPGVCSSPELDPKGTGEAP